MKYLILLFVFYSAASFAQPSSSSSIPTVFASSLDGLRAKANSALLTAQKELKIEGAKGSDFSPCKAELLDFNVQYHQWFIDHYQVFKDREVAITSALSDINQKIETLKSIQMIELPGQTSGNEISLRTAIDFLSLLNTRLKNVPEEQLSLMISQMEKPQFNPTGATLNQITAALIKMTQNLNAKLKESYSSYSLECTQNSRSCDLAMIIHFKFPEGEKNIRFSLLDAKTLDLKSDIILQSSVSDGGTIDGYSPDANKRYFEMYEKLVSSVCAEERILYFDYIGETLGKPTPWAAVEELKAKIPSAETFNGSTAKGDFLIKKYGLTFTESTYSGAKTVNILENGQSLNCSMIRNDMKFIEYQNSLYIFAIGGDYQLYAHHHGSWKVLRAGNDPTMKITNVNIYQGKPAVMISNSKGSERVMID